MFYAWVDIWIFVYQEAYECGYAWTHTQRWKMYTDAQLLIKIATSFKVWPQSTLCFFDEPPTTAGSP